MVAAASAALRAGSGVICQTTLNIVSVYLAFYEQISVHHRSVFPTIEEEETKPLVKTTSKSDVGHGRTRHHAPAKRLPTRVDAPHPSSLPGWADPIRISDDLTHVADPDKDDRVLEPWGWRRVGGAFRGSISVNEFGAVSVVEVGSGGEKGKPTQLSIPAGFEITSQCCKEESFEVGYEERDDVLKEQFDKGVREVGVVPEDGETFTGPGCMRNSEPWYCRIYCNWRLGKNRISRILFLSMEKSPFTALNLSASVNSVSIRIKTEITLMEVEVNKKNTVNTSRSKLMGNLGPKKKVDSASEDFERCLMR
ncbi:hypothetical protein NC652_030850 [Populus alba x Populus x berolinensis]|nr:hypothetical protein NC652_030850 [Populus alba x Populus x berolinensis]